MPPLSLAAEIASWHTLAVRVTIVGFGLIGGSIGRRLLDNGWDVGFLDPHVTLDEARRHFAASRKVESLEAIPPHDLVVMATPVDVTRRLLQSNDFGNELTTVCSVMAPFSDLARVRGMRLTAGHPFAGAASSGLGAADIALFDGKRWFIDQESVSPTVERMIRACGALPVAVDPEEHDRAVAFTSHLPQLLSTALGAVIERSGIDLGLFGGSGLRTFLRLAESERSVWTPIFESNAIALEEATTDFIETVEAMLTGRDAEAFAAAQSAMKKMPS